MPIPLKYNLRNLLVRKTTTGLTAFGIGLVILIFIALSALVYGLRSTITQTGSGDNLMILGQGALALSSSTLDRNLIQEVKYLPEVRLNGAGEPLVSPELVVDENVYYEKLADYFPTPVRGVEPVAFGVHTDLKIEQGGPPSANGGVILGRKVAAQLGAIKVGDQIEIGTRNWTVNGIFSANDSMIESEIWMDLGDLTTYTKKKNISTLVLKLRQADMAGPLIPQLNDSPRLKATAVSETGYYGERTEDARNLWGLTLVISVVLGIAAVFAGMNTMYSTVADRMHEIGVLQAIGYSPRSILLSFVTEGAIIAGLGGAAACLIALTLQGISIKTVAAGQFLDFNLHVTPQALLSGLVLSLVIGVVGAFWPARRAAKLEAFQAMRSR